MRDIILDAIRKNPGEVLPLTPPTTELERNAELLAKELATTTPQDILDVMALAVAKKKTSFTLEGFPSLLSAQRRCRVIETLVPGMQAVITGFPAWNVTVTWRA